MPGYGHYKMMSELMTNVVKLGALSVTWTNEGRAFDYQKDGRRFRYDIGARKATLLGTAPTASSRTNRGGNRASSSPARGRQFTSALSPDGRFKAFYRDRNLWLSETNRTNEIAITKDGSEKTRIKYGTASWVYGEELFQNTVMWWSTNSQKLAYYRFDESGVADYYLQLDQTKLLSTVETPATRGGRREMLFSGSLP